MSRFKERYLYSLIVIASTFLLASCNSTENTKDQCQRFTKVMQTVVDETQTGKQNSKFDRDALLQFTTITKKSTEEIREQSPFNDKSLASFQSDFVSLYKKYTSAGSNLLQLSDIKTNPKRGYSSLNTIKQSIPEEKELITSFNNYCNPHGFKINNVVP